MATEKALAAARLLGERAGRAFMGTGIWPRCPFRDPGSALYLAWVDGVFSVTGPGLAPEQPPPSDG